MIKFFRRAMPSEKLGYLLVALTGRKAQRSKAAIIYGVKIRALGNEKLNYTSIVFEGRRGFVQRRAAPKILLINVCTPGKEAFHFGFPAHPGRSVETP